MDAATRTELWVAMAELFLDTDTRPLVPSLAARCVRAGLTPAAARRIWRYEVAPAVAVNLWIVAGEWAYWPRDWLIARITRRRRRRRVMPGALRALAYWATASSIEPLWRAVSRCMVALAACAPADADARAADLEWLARVFFDFAPAAMPLRAPGELYRVYKATFLPIFTPLTRGDSGALSLAACRARVSYALRSAS